ncbi:hypothetical protein WA158_007985 [Blastocystis sp. Blastoise]
MYLEEIILDGFKSYANRTVISDFDPQFNAITGLNGSGKSNILDAICFVLGITNLTQVRVRNMQELVYKQGQAGVTKATVTLIFNNKDSKQSPVGYEQYETISITRSIIIGGRNKYMINGHVAQTSQVQNLFHSVQLNVNNPHFLIMQGRITKVLNMKPPEILGMVEEAAGTRMFESKKEAAKKTIEKKQGKVDEINKLLSEEITPTLETLRAQKSAYIQWSNNTTEIERLHRFKVAYDYYRYKDIVDKGEEGVEETIKQKDQFIEQINTIKSSDNENKKQLENLKVRRDQQVEETLTQLQSEETQKSKDLVKKNGEYINELSALEREQTAFNDIKRQQTDSTTVIHDLEMQTKKVEEEVVSCTNELSQLQNRLTEYENAALSFETGGITTEEEGNIGERINENKALLTNTRGTIAQTEQKLEMSNQMLVSLEGKHKLFTESNKHMEEEHKSRIDLIHKYENELNKLEFNNNRYNEIQIILNNKEREIQHVSDESDKLDATVNSCLHFEYTTPTNRNFKENGVKGIVANLIHVENRDYITALETVAGGKLYQIVVDTEETGKCLLNEGHLRKRYTFIPLNRIKSRVLPPHKVSLAQKIGGNDVGLALSFIASDEELAPAMQYVFGNTLICKDLNTARKVTFNEGIRTKSVTLEGDSCDPSGTLEGGSRDREANILQTLYRVNELHNQLEALRHEHMNIRKEFEILSTKRQRFSELSTSLELEKHNLELLDQKMKMSDSGILSQQIADIHGEIEEYNKVIEENKKKEQEIFEKIKLLESKQNTMMNSKEDYMKGVEKKILEVKKELKKKDKELNTKKHHAQELQIELDQAKYEYNNILTKISTSEGIIISLKENVSKYNTELNELKSNYESTQKDVQEKKKEIESYEIEIKRMIKEQDNNIKVINDLETNIRKLDNQISKIQKEKQESMKQVSKLLSDFPWIEEEKQYFGKEGTDYDFNIKNPQDRIDRLQQLESEQDKLGRRINKKVMTMLEKAEGEYTDLLKKKKIIEKDKTQIQHVIEELETKKNEALQRTYQKVNHDFGDIFTSLLPGASARLEPPEGQNVTEGLEVRVAFSGKDKESLSELSGGQRSLLALSLVLSLLLFKPAPMYILDEVDAALDLSHTQNIGRMLRKHFGQSQFIIVSLKEGMFNNANVIFRTKFVDGVSTVTRTLGRTNNKNDDDNQSKRIRKE